MKIIRTGLTVIVLALVAAMAFCAVISRSPDPRAWWVAAQVQAMNHGLLSPRDADWDFIKLRSGAYGVTALDDLRHNGASDDIRITADYVLRNYKGKDAMCDDAPCGWKVDMKTFKPRAAALQLRQELSPGQQLPHDFVVETANILPQCRPGCVLRMQDFDGDGKDEVYIEHVRSEGPDAPEEEGRSLTIYHHEIDGWKPQPRVFLWNFDARTFPQRPFILEAMPFDVMSVAGVAFPFVPAPDHFRWGAPSAAPLSTRGLGPVISDMRVIYPANGKLPTDVAQSLAAGPITPVRLSNNPLIPQSMGNVHKTPPAQYTRLEPVYDGLFSRLILADLDHDGLAEVIVVTDADPNNKYSPYHAALLKRDGRGWRIAANAELCKEDVGVIDTKTITFAKSSERMIRLGGNVYPVAPVRYCDTGIPRL